MDLEKTIINAMARALFVQAYADQQEEAGRKVPPRTDWMDIAPKTPAAVVSEAYRLAGMIEQLNKASILALFAAARRCDGIQGVAENLPAYANSFGHYAAMGSLGHGVSWTDDHKPVVLLGKTMMLPYFEFHLDDVTPEASPSMG